MGNINFVKNIDGLGRIVIPMDIRRKLGINSGDYLSICCNENNISLCKYNTLRENIKIKDIIDLFSEYFGLKYILVDVDSVVCSNIVPSKLLINDDLKLNVRGALTVKYLERDFIFGDKKYSGIWSMIPIVSNDGILGSLIIFGNTINHYEFGEVISKLISLQINIT